MTETTDNGWQPIETAPKDGSIVLITNGKTVYAGAWMPAIHGQGFPWVIIEPIEGRSHGCCDHEDETRIPTNGWLLSEPINWRSLYSMLP